MGNKKLYILVGFIGLLISLSCSKVEDTVPQFPYWGVAPIKFNGLPMNFLPYCDRDSDKLYVAMFCMKCDSSLDYELSFAKIQRKQYLIDSLGSYQFMSNNDHEYASLYSLIGGDVAVRGYRVFEKENNYLEIKDWNESTGEITGKFKVTFIGDSISPGHPDSEGPDTIRLICDQFLTRIYK